MEYVHNVKYYETDKMGITHHSNYVRWMEEARVNYLNSIGCNDRKLEEEGVISPVIGVNLSYKNTTTFDDLVTIKIKVLEYSGIKLKFSYEMVKEDGKVACIAESDHCFLSTLGRPINMKREKPLLHEILLKELENNK